HHRRCATRAPPRATAAASGRAPTGHRRQTATRRPDPPASGGPPPDRVRAPFYALEAVLDRQRRRLDRGGLGLRRRRLGTLNAERLLELAGLIHLGDDVAAAHKLAVDEQLRNR